MDGRGMESSEKGSDWIRVVRVGSASTVIRCLEIGTETTRALSLLTLLNSLDWVMANTAQGMNKQV